MTTDAAAATGRVQPVGAAGSGFTLHLQALPLRFTPRATGRRPVLLAQGDAVTFTRKNWRGFAATVAVLRKVTVS